jgi:hypothetical protein
MRNCTDCTHHRHEENERLDVDNLIDAKPEESNQILIDLNGQMACFDPKTHNHNIFCNASNWSLHSY